MPVFRRCTATALALAALLWLPPAPGADQAGGAAGHDGQTLDYALELLSPEPEYRLNALRWMRARGKADVVPALIQMRRFLRNEPALDSLLRELTGAEGVDGWHGWMLWQEAHPEIAPFAGFDVFKAAVFQNLDENFADFLRPGVAHEIRLEEIVWGGVRKDGIPALTNPDLLPAGAAGYLSDDELVFGVTINGDARAYPLRIMDWHEMFNDVIGGVPVSLAYCTLCGSGILFETAVAGRGDAFVFGSSGLLYRSNKLMYDQQSLSLWNQFTGRPVVGPLTGSGLQLKTRPVAIASWADWRAANPRTRVLSLETGHRRDYRPGAPYGDYFASPGLMFPALLGRTELKPKDYVFALRSSGSEKAWPLARFAGGRVINDTAGILDLVLIGDQATRSVRAYRRDGRHFEKSEDPTVLTSAGETWRVTEEALIGPGGASLARLPGHIAYWFAWSGYLGDAGELAIE
jgi:hypothetical protein